MKIIIAPTKKMKTEDSFDWPMTTPVFLKESQELRKHMASLDMDTLKKVIKASDSITQETYNFYHQNYPKSPAILTYSGIAFQYMAPDVFTDDEMSYIQEHVRILSGLYGILKPWDAIQPYRLEMQAKCPFSLYEFWKDTLANELNDDLIINLASEEYAKCIRKYHPLIDVRFVEANLKEKGVYAKMARGEMVRYMAENKIQTIEELKNFDCQNYQFSPEHSKENLLVFIRK